MLIEGVKLSNGQVLPIAVDDNGKLLISGVTIDGDVTIGAEVEVKNDTGNPVPVSGPLTNTQLRSEALPVSGPVTNDQIRASDLPVTLDGEAVTVSGSVEVTNDSGNPLPISGTVEITNDSGNTIPVSLPSPAIPGLNIPTHNYISLTYTGSDLTGIVYKSGGSGGTTVATLALAYSNGLLASITRS